MSAERTLEALTAAALSSPVVMQRKRLADKRKPLHDLFLRHAGSQYALSKKTGIPRTRIREWFAGEHSHGPVEQAIFARAEELLLLERKAATKDGDSESARAA